MRCRQRCPRLQRCAAVPRSLPPRPHTDNNQLLAHAHTPPQAARTFRLTLCLGSTRPPPLPTRSSHSPDFAREMAGLAGPFVKAADALVGERVAMRIDAELVPEGAANETDAKAVKILSSLFVHKSLGVSVGNSVAAFARAAIEGGNKAGGALR